MALTFNSRSNSRGRYRPLSEINVTPLVDVMLVLLIIFMVTAPLMTSGVSVDLPKTDAKPLNSDSQPLTVSIDAQGKIFLQDQQRTLQAQRRPSEGRVRAAACCNAFSEVRTGMLVSWV